MKATAADCPPPSHGLSIREPVALRTSPMRLPLSAIRAWTRCSVVDTTVPPVGVELVPSLISRRPHVFHDPHLFDRRVQRIGCRAGGIDHGVPSSVRGDSCVLARRAPRLGGYACLPSSSNNSVRCSVQHSGHSHLWHTLSVIGEVRHATTDISFGLHNLRFWRSSTRLGRRHIALDGQPAA